MTLEHQQSALLEAIFSQPGPGEPLTAKGLAVYQKSLLHNASFALKITFATVHSFVGEAVFQELVAGYLQTGLKSEYDWGEFGLDFPQFIAGQAINHAALLGSLAGLDYACHQSERSEDASRDLESFNLLAGQDPYLLSLSLSAGTRVLSSAFPLDAIITDMQKLNTEETPLAFSEIDKQLSYYSQKYPRKQQDNSKVNADDEQFYYLVWRPHFQAQYTRITAAEYQWLQLWLSAEDDPALSLGQALDKAGEDFSIVDWLPKAIEQQLLNAVYLKQTL
ncbi:putative DNA-binding domain-containing protein [Thalassomonas viridans]|uniref:DNA-binding domain-containing protein n=1 Tax=Thalassomonas viridans TaxID=137584 RepID=A0AAF0CCM1_9GAMM|nr:putative DNA-binding domain-containing protein [Thalassomonas viridans]WDE08548.1 putative DNA-binding domain-containing protein [Thalassomonas viridans]